uniref:Ig-like domain-containing protein n=1 Tax=Cyprinus carpio TaxID=7962 RepID=A0A8C1R5F2_CYPCA
MILSIITSRLTVQTETSQIFRGETVTLTCDIQGEDWTYTWQCGDKQQNSDDEEFKITVQFKQSCKCKGCRESFCSEWSDAETLTVSCEIKACSKTKTLSEVRVSDGGRYACSVERETTQSQGVMLTVEERPKPVVRVQPDGRVFRGQTVTLTCDIQDTDVTNWSYSWNKDDSEIHVSQSQEYRISSVSESHTGNYRCTGRETGGSRYSHTSDKVTLTVSGECVYLTITCLEGLLFTLKKRGVYKVTLLFSSCSAFNPSKVHTHTPGQTVTLTCDIQDTNVTNWSYIWNKDDSEIHVSQSQEYRISSVSESHTGNYSCTGRETGGSRYSHTSDKVTLTVSGECVYICPHHI